MYMKPRMSDLIEHLETFSYFNFPSISKVLKKDKSQKKCLADHLAHTGSRISGSFH